jgi:hypothetical protein
MTPGSSNLSQNYREKSVASGCIWTSMSELPGFNRDAKGYKIRQVL